jgi:hypothetical protein
VKKGFVFVLSYDSMAPLNDEQVSLTILTVKEIWDLLRNTEPITIPRSINTGRKETLLEHIQKNVSPEGLAFLHKAAQDKVAAKNKRKRQDGPYIRRVARKAEEREMEEVHDVNK